MAYKQLKRGSMKMLDCGFELFDDLEYIPAPPIEEKYKLPGKAGDLQQIVYDNLVHPQSVLSRDLTLFLLQSYASPRYNIQSGGLSSQYLMLAPSGAGKTEALNTVQTILNAAIRITTNPDGYNTAAMGSQLQEYIKHTKYRSLFSSGTAFLQEAQMNPHIVIMVDEAIGQLKKLASTNTELASELQSVYAQAFDSAGADGELSDKLASSETYKIGANPIAPETRRCISELILAQNTPEILDIVRTLLTNGTGYITRKHIRFFPKTKREVKRVGGKEIKAVYKPHRASAKDMINNEDYRDTLKWLGEYIFTNRMYSISHSLDGTGRGKGVPTDTLNLLIPKDDIIEVQMGDDVHRQLHIIREAVSHNFVERPDPLFNNLYTRIDLLVARQAGVLAICEDMDNPVMSVDTLWQCFEVEMGLIHEFKKEFTRQAGCLDADNNSEEVYKLAVNMVNNKGEFNKWVTGKANPEVMKQHFANNRVRISDLKRCVKKSIPTLLRKNPYGRNPFMDIVNDLVCTGLLKKYKHGVVEVSIDGGFLSEQPPTNTPPTSIIEAYAEYAETAPPPTNGATTPAVDAFALIEREGLEYKPDGESNYKIQCPSCGSNALSVRNDGLHNCLKPECERKGSPADLRGVIEELTQKECLPIPLTQTPVKTQPMQFKPLNVPMLDTNTTVEYNKVNNDGSFTPATFEGDVRYNYKQVLRLRKDSADGKFPITLFYGRVTLPNGGTKVGYFCGNIPKPTYTLYQQELIDSADTPVCIVEGEKACEAYNAKRERSTSLVFNRLPPVGVSLAGTNLVDKTDLTPLAGRDIVIFPDNDQTGYNFASTLGKVLTEKHNCTVQYIDTQELKCAKGIKGWDIADLNGSLSDFQLTSELPNLKAPAYYMELQSGGTKPTTTLIVGSAVGEGDIPTPEQLTDALYSPEGRILGADVLMSKLRILRELPEDSELGTALHAIPDLGKHNTVVYKANTARDYLQKNGKDIKDGKVLCIDYTDDWKADPIAKRDMPIRVVTEDIVTIDFETYYDDDVGFDSNSLPKEFRDHHYVTNDKFQVLMMGYKVGTAPTQIAEGDAIPKLLREWVSGNKLIVAHNAKFEGTVITQHYKLPITNIMCTMQLAQYLYGVQTAVSLDALATALQLGKKGDDAERASGKYRADFTDAEWAAYKSYCVQDVELTAELYFRCHHQLPPFKLNSLRQVICNYINPVLQIDASALPSTETDIPQDILDTSNSHHKFSECVSNAGLTPPPALNEDALADWCRDNKEAIAKTPEVQQLLVARAYAKDSNMRSKIQALHTARALGHLPEGSNFGKLHSKRLGGEGNATLLTFPKHTLGKAVVAPEGYTILHADFSQVEPRAMGSLFGVTKMQEVFADKSRDLYKEFAKVAYNLASVDEVTKAQRTASKVAVLGLGYGMGVNKFKWHLKSGLGHSDDALAKRLHEAYHNHYPEVRKGYKAMEALFDRDTEGKFEVAGFVLKGSVLHHKGSGLELNYTNWGWAGLDEYGNPLLSHITALYPKGLAFQKGVRIRLWGGTLFNHAVQSLAYCITEEALNRLPQDFGVVATIHDCIVAVVKDEAVADKAKQLKDAMEQAPDWLPNIPLTVEVEAGKSLGTLEQI